MNIDGFLLHKIILNLKKFEGKRLKKVYQSSRFNFYFKFDNESIQISTDPSNPFLTFTDKKEEYTFTSPFLTFLRRKISGTFLEEIRQIENDRIIYFSFIRKNPFGELLKTNIVVELMGPNSNIIVIDENDKIQIILKRKISNKRTLMEGSIYKVISSDKIQINDLSKEIFLKNKIENFKDLTGLIQGISSKTAKILIDDTEDKNDIWKNIVRLKESYNNPYIYLNKKNMQIYPYEIPYIETEKVNVIDYINENAGREKVTDDLEIYKNKFLKIVKKELDKKIKLQNNLQRELSGVKDFDEYKYYGNLIISNIYKIKDKTEKVELYDWEEDKNVQISLDPNLSPTQNSQKYFKYYEKAKRKYHGLIKRMKSIQADYNYLDQLLQMIELCENRNEIDEIKIELQKNNLLKSNKRVYQIEKNKNKSVYKTYEYEGFKFLIGRNNYQNDELTKGAAKDDYWFHTKEIPGAHVILKTAGKEPEEGVLLYGASLAAYFSKGRISSKVTVDCTKVRNVWKPKGAKPGMVLYKNQKSYTVTPEIKEDNN